VESLLRNRERTHLLGVYGLGKCQRMLRLVRDAGYGEPIYLHGALAALTELYRQLGHDFGDIRPVDPQQKHAGALVFCPPSALADRWSRRFADPLAAFASGWMRVRGRARQRGVELPLVVSDHADWPDLLQTIVETGAEDVWVTHGREDALVHQLALLGRRGRALSLVGFQEEAD
jgi:putative mRNA 3-end processing factor